ncbi:MAG: hypothetical protein A2637_06245 [Candidatus Muproteobacteria bacterium RIFCSPHIGHO2_01_FULL_65_16]|uniref:DUF945 domain-containing protein n=1 Tax=Candidatus Muproteobacteria bacterium RIFCSPHIGHO2_01_FULL_65_16 TaxID=1817764 RepID=A0A1F6TP51_9PROT|nr:MAG: hypothetical protein A2637_06245 [Candidatus Muproteobacteria bacterium RIFCSPHIGHO2_01_FULL_65_16]
MAVDGRRDTRDKLIDLTRAQDHLPTPNPNPAAGARIPPRADNGKARLKKIGVVLGGVMVLALAALAGAAFWFGLEAEKTYQHMIERFSTGGAQVTTTRYERGWLASRAETVVRFPGVPFEITAAHDISHGPIPFARLPDGVGGLRPVQAAVKTRFSLAAKGQDERLKFLSSLPALDADITVDLDGAGRVRTELPPLTKPAAGGGRLEWRGLNGEITFDREWKRFKTEIHAPGLSFSAPPPAAGGGQDPGGRPAVRGIPGGVTFEQLAVRADLHEGVGGYLLGETTVTLDSISAGPLLRLQGLQFSSVARAAGNDINLELTYRLDALGLADQRHGPALLAVEVRRLDAAAIGKFEKEMNAIYRQGLPEEQASLMLMGKMLGLVGELSKKVPELEVTKLSVKTAMGEITGKAKIVLDGSKADIGENPMLVLTAVSGDMELIMPAGVLKPLLAPLIMQDIQAYRQGGRLTAEEIGRLDPETLARVVDQALPLYLSRHDLTKYLIHDNGQYRIVATLRQGQILVNNQPWRVRPAQFP